MEDADIKADLKEIKSDIKEINGSLARNTASLEVHVYRTELAEKRIGRVESWILGLLTAMLVAVATAIIKTII